MKELERLLSIIYTLRGPDGCPWDRKQSLKSMTSQILEEAYELVESLEDGNLENIREELGDLMFLTLFTAVVAEQEGKFSLEETVQEVADKLVRRHPHVFGDSKAEDIDEILQNWEAIKSREKKNQERKTIFDGIPRSLPEPEKYAKILQKIERQTHPLREDPEIYRDLDVNQLNRDFSAKNLKEFLSRLLKRAYVEDIGVGEILRSLSKQEMNRFLVRSEKEVK